MEEDGCAVRGWQSLYLVGYRIGYSLSPHIYNRLFEDIDVPARYQLLDVNPEGLDEAVASVRRRGCLGFNVTKPYKVRIVPLLDRLSPEAAEIGAVNLVTNNSGALTGSNTDWIGFLHALTSISGVSRFKSAVVLGAGGAARAAVYALRGRCSSLTIASRSGVSAVELAETAVSWGFREVVGLSASSPKLLHAASHADLLVNATPVGSLGMGGIPVPEDRIREGSVVLDMVYRPLRTPLLRAAESRGCTVVDGLWMLAYQAAENLRRWMGISVSPMRLRRYGLEALEGER